MSVGVAQGQQNDFVGSLVPPYSQPRDDQCDLGKWLLGEGKKHDNLAEYAELKTKHSRFHATVAQVVTQAKTLPGSQALALVDSLNSDYGRASSDCINAIAKLKKAIG